MARPFTASPPTARPVAALAIGLAVALGPWAARLRAHTTRGAAPLVMSARRVTRPGLSRTPLRRFCAVAVAIWLTASPSAPGGWLRAAQPDETQRALIAAVIAADSQEAREALVAAAGGGGVRFHNELSNAVIVGQGLPLERALAILRYTADLAIRAGDHKTHAVAILKQGVAQGRLGRYDLALAAFEETRAEAEHLGDIELQGSAWDNIGIVHRRRSELALATAAYEHALALATRAGSQGSEARILNNLGSLWTDQGHYRVALSYLTRSAALKAALQMEGVDVVTTLGNIASIHELRGDVDLALDYWQRALAVPGGDRDLSSRASVRIGLAQNHMRLEQWAEARAQFEAALTAVEAAGEQRSIGLVLFGIAELEWLQGHSEAALATARRALAVRAAIGNPHGQVDSLNLIVRILLDLKQPEEAKQRALEAGALARTIGGLDLRWRASARLGEAERALGHRAEAIAAYTDAIAAVEDVRATASDEARERQQVLAMRLDPYRELVDLLVESGRADEALATSELAKARTLIELLESAQAGQNAPDASGDLVRSTGPVNLAPLLVTPAHAVVSFAVAGTTTSAFVARRDDRGRTTVTAIRLPVTHAELARRTTRFREQLATRDLAIAQSARDLYNALIAPLAPALAGAQHWTIVPDGPLWELPFQALMSPTGRYLIEDVAVTLAPSVHALAALMERGKSRAPRGTDALIIGSAGGGAPDAPLKEAEQQARSIAALYGRRGQLVVGARATPQTVRDGGSARILHVAAHGVFDGGNPMRSYVQLGAAGADGELPVLDAARMLELRLGSDLVVLSACDSGRGRVREGEGLIGLTWAVLAAGAGSAVVSEWQVDSVSTTEFMMAFHRRIRDSVLKTGHVAGRADALRAAALQLLTGGTYAHPFYWAPFVLVGDGT